MASSIFNYKFYLYFSLSLYTYVYTYNIYDIRTYMSEVTVIWKRYSSLILQEFSFFPSFFFFFFFSANVQLCSRNDVRQRFLISLKEYSKYAWEKWFWNCSLKNLQYRSLSKIKYSVLINLINIRSKQSLKLEDKNSYIIRKQVYIGDTLISIFFSLF